MTDITQGTWQVQDELDMKIVDEVIQVSQEVFVQWARHDAGRPSPRKCRKDHCGDYPLQW